MALHADLLNTIEKQDKNDLQKTLEIMKMDYVNTLQTHYTYPAKRFFYTRPGYFSADAATKLLLIELKIGLIAQMLGIEMKRWCLAQKEFFEMNNQVSTSVVKKQILTRLVAPWFVLFIVVVSLGFNLKKEQTVEDYDATMQQVEAAFKSENYDEALTQCIMAKEIGEQIFGSPTMALRASNELEHILFKKEEDLIEMGRYDDAITWIKNLSKQYTADDKVASILNHHLEDLIARKTAEISEGLPDLIDDISRNGGKLSDKSKAKLRRLLQIDSENYWLKIIAARELNKTRI